jgi:murein DD-endopeptidase MepM/ murein hydrolase activator NlpD
MKSKPRLIPSVILAAFVGFVVGAVVMAMVFAGAPRMNASGMPADDCGPSAMAAPPGEAGSPAAPLDPAPARETAAAKADPPPAVPEIGIDPVADLEARALTVPVRGVDADDLVRSFGDTRSGNRRHEAIDILAPRHTPVLAVEDGQLVKFFHSKAGGNTIYQFDPASRYAYYYAHLDRYAAGVKEGDRVRKGQVIGYVGTTGNAPPDTPHLHFAIFRLTEAKQWWKGTPIDPFDVWR